MNFFRHDWTQVHYSMTSESDIDLFVLKVNGLHSSDITSALEPTVRS